MLGRKELQERVGGQHQQAAESSVIPGVCRMREGFSVSICGQTSGFGALAQRRQCSCVQAGERCQAQGREYSSLGICDWIQNSFWKKE